MRAYSPMNIACRSCGMNPATYQCTHCERYDERPSLLCLDCARRHSEVAAFRNHEMVALGPSGASAHMNSGNMNMPHQQHPLAMMHHNKGLLPAPSLGPTGGAGRNAAAHYVRSLTLHSHSTNTAHALHSHIQTMQFALQKANHCVHVFLLPSHPPNPTHL